VPDADVRASGIRSSADGCRFTLSLGTQDAEVALPVVGTHQAHNALAAAAVGYVLRLSLDEIARGLAHAPVAKMRQELLTVDDVLIIDDSYNASPQSMATAFEVLRQVGGRRRRVLVLGEMLELGPDAPAFHREAGDLAAALKPALLIAVGPNARWYLEGAGRAALPAETTAWASTADEAIPIVREFVRPGDVVLVKGSRGIVLEHVVSALRQDGVAGRL
jgi:UDP-N-acetylmuramoyl-tripeptide--D-alanyl-D-alanine ligase